LNGNYSYYVTWISFPAGAVANGVGMRYTLSQLYCAGINSAHITA